MIKSHKKLLSYLAATWRFENLHQQFEGLLQHIRRGHVDFGHHHKYWNAVSRMPAL